ncbi:MAG: RNA-binding transcriptional accessory protein [Flavobacteriales bacterium]|nr:RNA-binding transcriptional accessory protein [Flavobacteriales bacterium]
MNDIIIDKIAQILDLKFEAVQAVNKLFQKDATIPFIARYRKEATGGLDEVVIENIKKELDGFTELNKRKETVIKTLKEIGKYTDQLQLKIDNIWDSATLEDFYLPYKPKKSTKASVARSKGLEPLAKIIMAQNELNIEGRAQSFANGITVDDALEGARHIIAEWVSENRKARNHVRHEFEKGTIIFSKLVKNKDKEGSNFSDYFDFKDRLQRCPSHRIMAMFRGEKEGVLRLSLDPVNENTLETLEELFVHGVYDVSDHVRLAVRDAYKRLIKPSIETEFKKRFKEKADVECIKIFEQNLKQLLLAAPVGEKIVLAIDPGFRTGCKTVVLDAKGNLKAKATLHFTTGNQYEKPFNELLEKHKVEVIAIGDGTASRETETKVRSLVKNKEIEVYVISEAGASIYSGSEVAREEFPNEDITVRGAISIGRRLMDPLSELVKIDPKSIGVGQYQYDVNQKQLRLSLDRVVESAVNEVGVNINVASKYLLKYVSGISLKTAENIVRHRKKRGKFKSRKELLDVDGLGSKTYELSAGFMRIKKGENPLDDSAVHPESYYVVQAMAKKIGESTHSMIGNATLLERIKKEDFVSDKIGLYTLNDILKELKRPGVDPRGKAEIFKFDDRVKQIEDLQVGMKLPGLVTNITKFGAFVDIGVKQDGLVHVSQLSNQYVKDPLDVVKLRDHVWVKVLDVDIRRSRINLSMKQV